MDKKEIQQIVDETEFSMEVEGFILPDDEKENIKKVLNGTVSFEEQLKKYIDSAKRAGGINVPY